MILFDVFHHLEHPRTALRECRRVLAARGRVIIFDPVREPDRPHRLRAAASRADWRRCRLPPMRRVFRSASTFYYAAQGNATRVFWQAHAPEILDGWDVIARERIGAWAYALTGGYSKPQLYPTALYPVMRGLDQVCRNGAAVVGSACADCLEPFGLANTDAEHADDGAVGALFELH